MGSLLGLVLHAVGGFAAGSFYIPIKQVREWAWESSWFVLALSAWLVVPMVFAALSVPALGEVLSGTSSQTLFITYGFGVLWGVGGLTFGLALRYLGISLGMAVALGLTAAFGTLVPPLYEGTFGSLLASTSGQTILFGVVLCLVGIGICGYAGVLKDRHVGQVKRAVEDEDISDEFSLRKGIIVALVAGLLSACFAFGLAAGAPIAERAISSGAKPLFQNNAILVVILLGGLTSNLLYTITLNMRNGTWRDYTTSEKPRLRNSAWSALGGLTWYLQFFFYGMGETFLGEQFSFASWSIHMAFIILFSTLWGIYFLEWKEAGKAAHRSLAMGLAILVLSTVLIGVGGSLG